MKSLKADPTNSARTLPTTKNQIQEHPKMAALEHTLPNLSRSLTSFLAVQQCRFCRVQSRGIGLSIVERAHI
jgi:hypothetical protein